MHNRCLAFASLLGALLVSGCTIITEGNQANPPPPPPPPPPAAVPAPQPAVTTPPPVTPAPAPTDQGGGTSRAIVRGFKSGSVLVMVVGGNCRIGVNGHEQGVGTRKDIKLGVGEHTVTCTPSGGLAQTQKVSVKENEQTEVTFDLTNPGNSRQVTRPVNHAPPVGRPSL
ncbi:MAG: hypothetical protein R3B72_15390 [Polyangiaceae bacterium]